MDNAMLELEDVGGLLRDNEAREVSFSGVDGATYHLFMQTAFE